MGTTEAATAQPLLHLTQRRSVWVRRPGMHACAHTLTYAHTGRRTRTHAHTCALHTHTHSHTRRGTSNTHREGLRGRGAVRLQSVRFLRAGSNLASRVPAGAGPAPCLH